MNKTFFFALSALSIFLSALCIVIIFLLLTNPKINLLLKEKLKKPLNTEWNYDYECKIDTDADYPLVHLRSGFKVIKKIGDKLLVGWKYEVINVSKDSFLVTIDYKVNDYEGFTVGEGKGKEYIKGGKIETVIDTFRVPFEDLERLDTSNWTVIFSHEYKKKKINRFKEAGKILKDNSPFWLQRYLKWRFDDDKDIERGKKDNDKWAIIAEVMGIKPDPELLTLRKKLGLTDDWKLSPWGKTKNLPEYKALIEMEKTKIKNWLHLQEEFGWQDGVAPNAVEYLGR